MALELFTTFNVVTAIVSLFMALYLWAKYNRTYWKRQGIHSLPSHWLLGNVSLHLTKRPTVSEDIENIYLKTNESHHVVGIYLLHLPCLLVRSYHTLKHIMLKDFNSFCNRNIMANTKNDVLGALSIIGIKDDTWRYVRSKLMPAFSPNNLKKMIDLVLVQNDYLIEYMNKVIGDTPTTMEFLDISRRYSTDNMGSINFGIQTDCISNKNSEFYQKSQDLFRESSKRDIEIFSLLVDSKINDLLGFSLLKNYTNYYCKLFWDSINHREKMNESRGDAIDFFIQLKNEPQNPDFVFEGDRLMAQNVGIFYAGFEANTRLLAFSLYEIARHPEIQNKLREEIREMVEDKPLNYENICKLTYMQQVINETLRLHPPIPQTNRLAGEDYKIPDTDIVIKKGTKIFIPISSFHTDPQYFPDPYKFDPDRFSPERKAEIKPYTFIPFGDGPRICIGKRTAILQATLGLASILRNFKVELDPNHKYEIYKNFTTSFRYGLYLRFTKIK